VIYLIVICYVVFLAFLLFVNYRIHEVCDRDASSTKPRSKPKA
jgi:hypothetical protein